MRNMGLILNSETLERFYEIAFVRILDNIIKTTPNEKLDYFLEHFCKVYDIDFTSMSILKNMYYPKMRPTKMEISIFTWGTGLPRFKLPIDYRTFRKYVKNWKIEGQTKLNPYIVNAFLKPVVKKFVDIYVKLMFDDLEFVKRITEVKLDEHRD